MATPIFYGHLQRSPSVKGGGGGRFLTVGKGERNNLLWFGDINPSPLGQIFKLEAYNMLFRYFTCYLPINDIYSPSKCFIVLHLYFISAVVTRSYISVTVWLARLGDAIAYSETASKECFYFCY